MIDPSAEVAAMQSAERKKWLTIAEGQRVREQWRTTVKAMEDAVEKYDQNPEDETEALMLTMLGALTVSGFTKVASDAMKRMAELAKGSVDA